MIKASGEEALSIPFKEFAEIAEVEGEPVNILALKRHLQPLCGQTRFKQRLLLPDGQMLSDDFVMAGPMDVQLILCHFEATSEEQLWQLQNFSIRNNVHGMERVLKRPQDPDLESETLPPALHAACFAGSIEAARLLLEAEADKDKADNRGSTPIFVASATAHVEAVQLLLEARADKDRPITLVQLRWLWPPKKVTWKLFVCCWKPVLTKTRPPTLA